MNLDQIETKCFILALFIRDDGQRFLLGSRMFEFVDSQLHFTANVYQNDVVEVQGNDGVMLAGQVRRGNSQAFDGYIGDSSVDRHVIEQNRREFFKFFRKNHYYKVVYVLPNGQAIQRRQGFIVEAPEVKELYQLFPKYHISMNFEDINYYNYEEDSEGEEIYGESAKLKVATSATGGLIWANSEQWTITEEGTDFTIQNTSSGTTLSSVQLKGDTTQQTYSGKNLWELPVNATSATTTLTNNADGTFNITGTANADGNFSVVVPLANSGIIAGQTYSLWSNKALGWADNAVSCFIQECTSDGTWVGNLAIFQANQSKTIPSSISTQYVKFVLVFRNGTKFNDYNNVKIQLVAGSSIDQNFEPYVGGIPSPNPDYPQTVNTVTGRQVVTITDGDSQSQSYEVNLGKNLVDSSSSLANTRLVAGGGTTSENGFSTTDYIEVQPNTAYTMSNVAVAAGFYGNIIQYNGSKTMVGERIYIANTTTSHTFTTEADAKYIRISQATTVFGTSLQFEKGSTATTYAPYFTPIELCKIGTYQDYIYKSSGNWYVHKVTNKLVFDGSDDEQWGYASGNGRFYCNANLYIGGVLPANDNGVVDMFCNSLVARSYQTAWTNVTNYSVTARYDNNSNPRIINTDYTSLANFKAWLSANPVTLYYPLATATDTQITNADLISQLNALAGATTYNGQTIFTVTSENQLAILRVAVLAGLGGGIVWDEYGATWEEGTGGGPTMIDVDSIDNVYPVWELTGPATNPQISVLNTNTTLSYSGTITASQTLKVDMFNKTATLNGTSVVGNVSGDWVYLEPGINRVTYTTGNADAPDSSIWWQEIVG